MVSDLEAGKVKRGPVLDQDPTKYDLRAGRMACDLELVEGISLGCRCSAGMVVG